MGSGWRVLGALSGHPALRICHLYPDLLNLYGDRGNIMVLTQRARWRGLPVTVTDVGLGQTIDPASADLFFIGGGEDRQQRIAADDLCRVKRTPLLEAVEGGAVVLAVCGGYQLVGRFYRSAAGEELPGVDLLDLWTEHPGPSARRLIGNLEIEVEGMAAPLIGFENHGGRTHLGPGARPLGRVLVGFGNNGEDGQEGAISRQVYGTYLHGPLLPKNPAFADRLIREAVGRRHPGFQLTPLSDAIETRARAVMLARLRNPTAG
ncbi:MAG TPA: glutamine amidotransferase [bacterium]|nr:glutamine amidotransferase [bacterium]